MHFGSGRDACFIMAMAVPVLEFAFLFAIDFPYIVCYFSGNFSLQEEKFFYRRILFLLRVQLLLKFTMLLIFLS